MPVTHDPYLLKTDKVDANRLTDDRAVQVGGNVEQRQRHLQDLRREAMVSTPEPYPCAAFVNWAIVVACMVILAVLSVPELRNAVAAAVKELTR